MKERATNRISVLLRLLLAGAPIIAGCGDDADPDGGGGAASTSTSSATTGGQGGGGPPGDCAVDADCELTIGCCTCGAAPLSAPPDPCEATADCEQSHCSALGIPEDTVAACAGGRCVMGFDCDLALATCDEAPPTCAGGATPRVVDGCYAGCVPADQCRSSSSP